MDMRMRNFILVALLLLAVLTIIHCGPENDTGRRISGDSDDEDDDEPSPDIPSAPRRLTATALSTSSIQLEWEDTSDNEEGFVVERQVIGYSWKEIPVFGENLESYTDEGLDCGVTYYYRVKAFNPFGESDYSNTDGATTFPCME